MFRDKFNSWRSFGNRWFQRFVNWALMTAFLLVSLCAILKCSQV